MEGAIARESLARPCQGVEAEVQTATGSRRWQRASEEQTFTHSGFRPDATADRPSAAYGAVQLTHGATALQYAWSHGPAIRIRLLSRRESVSHEPSSIPQQAWSALLAARPRPCPAGGHITLLLLGRWAHARQIHLAGCRLVPSESCSCSQRFARHSVGRRTSEGCRRRRPLPPRHREPPATACDQGWRRSSPAKAVARRAAARRRAGSAGRRLGLLPSSSQF